MSIAPFLERINTFIFDVDGVLTDGYVLVLENGLQARRMNIKDGYALQLAVKKGYRLVILSGAPVSPVVDRLNKLGITEVYMGIHDKKEFITSYIRQHDLLKDELLFMGDDIPDLDAMEVTGLSACPADAVPEILEVAKYVSPIPGGNGCVRDVIEMVMKIQGKWKHQNDIASR